MALEIVFRTVIPLSLLIAVGFLAKRHGIFKGDEERVLSYYAYYLALPAFMFVNLAETRFSLDTINFILVSGLPVIVFAILFLVWARMAAIDMNQTCLVIIGTCFGSVVFYGIPFIIFAFPDERAESLAAIAASVMGMVGLTITLFFFEIQSSKKESLWKTFCQIFPRLFKNPIFFSILTGIAISLTDIPLWEPISVSLKMLGRSAAPVALVMLGAYLYGKKYPNLPKSILLSQVRILLLPLLALLIAKLFHLPILEQKIAVLMNAMPLAISVAVFSQKYHFGEKTIASILLFSSISAIVYLNVWLLFLSN